jgi:hypothetical protein
LGLPGDGRWWRLRTHHDRVRVYGAQQLLELGPHVGRVIRRLKHGWRRNALLQVEDDT